MQTTTSATRAATRQPPEAAPRMRAKLHAPRAYRVMPAARFKKQRAIESEPRFERIASLAEALIDQAAAGAYGAVYSVRSHCEALFTLELAAIKHEFADKPLTVVGAAGIAELRIAATYARELLIGERENDRLFRRRALDASRAALLHEAS